MKEYERLTQEQIDIVQDAIMYGIDTVEFGYISTVWLGAKRDKEKDFMIKGFVPDVYRTANTSNGAMFNYSFESYGILWTVHKEEAKDNES